MLLKWIKKSEKSALFDQWVSQYHGILYKHALWMVGHRDTAQEVTQEAFYQAWLSLDSLKDDRKALAWLLTILRRTIYREQRSQYRNAETLEILRQFEQPQTQADSFTLLEIYSALDTLSPKLRDAFLLYHLHGFSYEEIGAQLEIPTGTVMSRISRAREALSKQHGLNNKTIFDIRRINRGTNNDG